MRVLVRRQGRPKIELLDRVLDVYGDWVAGGTRPNPLLERKAKILSKDLEAAIESCPMTDWGKAFLDPSKEWLSKCERHEEGEELTISDQPCMVALDFYRSIVHEDKKVRECFAPGYDLALWFVMASLKTNADTARDQWSKLKSMMLPGNP